MLKWYDSRLKKTFRNVYWTFFGGQKTNRKKKNAKNKFNWTKIDSFLNRENKVLSQKVSLLFFCRQQNGRSRILFLFKKKHEQGLCKQKKRNNFWDNIYLWTMKTYNKVVLLMWGFETLQYQNKKKGNSPQDFQFCHAGQVKERIIFYRKPCKSFFSFTNEVFH